MSARVLAVAVVVSTFGWASPSFAREPSTGPAITKASAPVSAGVPRREKGESAIGRLRIAPGLTTTSASMGTVTERAYRWTRSLRGNTMTSKNVPRK